MKTRYVMTAAFLLTGLAPLQSFSQEKSDWTFNLAPFYLWAISIDGDLGIREKSASTSIDFGDVWDNLNGVFTIRFDTFYRERFGLIVDYNYLDLGTEKVNEGVNAEADFTSQILNLAGAYRFRGGVHTWEGLAGIRYTSLDSEISLNNLGVRVSGDQDWVDPIVGLRYTWAINDTWSFRAYGDIGGFGAASDLTWQALGLISFKPWKHVSIAAGYRAIYTDYETGSGDDQFSYDATVYGPVAGVNINW